MNINNLELLKKVVEKRFGRRILSTRDCQMLCIEIFRTTGYKISINTIRRLFSLMKCEFRPSLFTVDLLSMYCRYDSYSAFTDAHQPVESGYSSLESSLIDLLSQSIEMMGEEGIDSKGKLFSQFENKLGNWPDLLHKFNCSQSLSASSGFTRQPLQNNERERAGI